MEEALSLFSKLGNQKVYHVNHIWRVVRCAISLFELYARLISFNTVLPFCFSQAIGVANNNLGTMVLQEQMESHGTERLFDNSLFGVCISEIYFVGIGYFNEAIRNGSFEYEIAKDTDDKVG